jgi:hypothetical protein
MPRREPNQSVLVPGLSQELTTQTFLVPTEFADRLELHALQLVEAMRTDERLDPNNELMQAMSYIVQAAVNAYLDEQQEGDICPPEML